MDHRIEEIIKKIEIDISRSLVVRNLAASINMSVSHFQHLFKKELHTSVIKYISELRMQKARKLLETSHLQVKEIRMKVGVMNEAHFLRLFKQKFGVTPNNYRKIFRNGRNE